MKKSLTNGDVPQSLGTSSAHVISSANFINQVQTPSKAESETHKQILLEQQACAELFMPTSTVVGTSPLTPKELQLLELLSFGYENGDIAEHFHTSRQAVKNMLRTINLKLGADNRTHAVAISFRNGLLPLKPQL